MNKLKRLLAFLAVLAVLCLGGWLIGFSPVAADPQKFVLQVSNAGTPVWTAVSYGNLNFTAGCTSTNNGGSVNINCASGLPTNTSGLTGEPLFAQYNASPQYLPPSIAECNGGAVVTTTPYLIAADDAVTTHTLKDRGTICTFGSGSSVVNIPVSGSATVNGMFFSGLYDVAPGTAALTVQRNSGSTDTFTVCGKICTDSLTSFTVNPGQWFVMRQSATGIWRVTLNMAVLSAQNAQTATYQVTSTDFANYTTILVASGTFTITLVPNTTQPPAGQYIKILNYGSGLVTVARSGQNINGGTGSFQIAAIPGTAIAADMAYVESNGTDYFETVAGPNASFLGGKTFASPAAIGTGTPAAATFTTTTTGSAGVVGVSDLSDGVTTAAMTAQTSATCTNVTNMTWNIAASKNYALQCVIPLTFAASATLQFCLGGPGTATSFSLEADGPIGAASAYQQISTLAQTAYGTKTGASGAPGAGAVVTVHAQIRNGATASGTALTLQTAANGTNAITVGADASCHLQQEN